MSNKNIVSLGSIAVPLAGTEVIPIWNGTTTAKVTVANLTDGRAVSVGSLTSTTTIVSGTTLTSGSYFIVQKGGVNYGYLGSASDVMVGGSLADFAITTPGVNNLVFGIANVEGFRLDTNLNLVIKTAAKGINFTANTPAAGMTSQLLNWYEEGTWTPVVTVTGGSITQAIQGTPKFTRSGRLVNASGYVNISVVNLPTGTLKITGLPYASATFAAATLALFTGGFTGSYSGYIDNAGTFVTVTNFNAATLIGGENVIFSITYPTT